RPCGLRLEQRVDSMEEAARLVRGHWQAGGQGLLLVQPPPRALDWQLEEMERVLAGLETEAQERGILGKAVTPFLLERLAQ
ncbi:MAG TPA: pseudouridine-5'-phosphate glycosidase, partial [Gemmatales bacterium]|nr:pseudouridine-5'-phosphate glycosidase [Gemmatales bacterium]